MKKLLTFTAACALATALATGAFAAEYTKGTVKKVDLKGKKVTIIHEELKNLDMPAMTMVFKVADDAMLEKVKEGQEIEFSADRINGNLTVVDLKE
ncbi:copper-binding protein [Roseibium litorale]|uniref:Copper-binding protein n=1 Tax=Roseibium litorale TaxID=2803841 RepID=A0ABR9CPE8_9HYPH|nr:copper-binding protein [Roseibium litorale]MBD8892539.1 copper-binding protein [Roseibium litorale]